MAARARHVSIDTVRLEALAEELGEEVASSLPGDPAHQRLGDDESTLAFVISLDAVNFGSGWFPILRKRRGMSGYFTIATALRERYEREGPCSAEKLASLRAADCTEIFGQDPNDPEIAVLMGHFARSLSDLGRFLLDRYGGRFSGLVEDAAGSAEGLVLLLAQMPLYRDVSTYEDLTVPLFKRAQITAADLALAFEGRGPGRFTDLDRLTIFADNLVPHVLRCENVLRYAPELDRRIARAELLQPGSREEVEIRAVALYAVEQMVACLSRRGAFRKGHRGLRRRSSEATGSAQQLDQLLWNRGQSPAIKSRNRHRTRTVCY